jgi:subtilisin family serine protease
VWGFRLTFAVAALFVVGLTPNAFADGRHIRTEQKAKPGQESSRAKSYKSDDEVTRRSGANPLHTSSVIVTLVPGATLPAEFKKFARGGKLDIINGHVLDLPNGVLRKLAAHPDIFRVHDNRPIKTHNYRTSVTVGATTVRDTMGLTGAGIGVAIIDSGITTWHDDLTNQSNSVYPYGNQRVTTFVDFVNGRTQPYDDNGHGSHVAGIIAGNGYDSNNDEKAGIAPGASLVSLKVLDANGQGTIGNIIAALNWVAVNAKTYNIRVVNMSVGAQIRESYWTDPLTLAVKAVTDRGVTVVAAAGNLGKNAAGHLQYGGITAPGNAPWVLTVGASSTMGTLTRKDDTMAAYSSNGPTFIDFAAKPDLVAPGTGTISLAVPGSTFYATKAQYLVTGSRPLGSIPYLALSGTSMAAPVVSGTVALMLQANPALTPNLIKAILQYTAQVYPGYSALREGAGFLNTLGAVRLAKFYATARPGDRMPVQKVWSRQIIWGNHRLTGGVLKPTGNAWATNIVWGTAKTLDLVGDNIVWGTMDASDNIVWGTAADDNIVWGTEAADLNNIVWGTAYADNIVWGTDCGGADCANVVWGTADLLDNIVWGTALATDNIVWGTSLDAANIVWGTSADADVTWGSDTPDAVVYPAEDTEPPPDVTLEFGDVIVPPVDITPLTVTAPGGVL